MTPHTIQFVIYLVAAAIFVAVATAVGAYFNRVLAVQSEAARRVPVRVKNELRK